MSASSKPIFLPLLANATAKFEETVDLPKVDKKDKRDPSDLSVYGDKKKRKRRKKRKF